MGPILAMHPKTARHHWVNTPASHWPLGVIRKAVAPGMLTNGGIGCHEEIFRRTSPTEEVGGMVSIKIK